MADRGHHPGALSYDPVCDVALRYPAWTVADADLAGLVPEVLCWERQVILLDAQQDPHARRSSLAHAVAHLDLGHRRVRAGFFENREEVEADRLAARRLIPLPHFLDAVAWSSDREEVAHALGVDAAMLGVREQALTHQERRRLRSARRGAVLPGD